MQIEIVHYIQEAKKHGLTEMEIKQNLLDAGWEAGVIESSFIFVRANETKAVNDKETAASNLQRDFSSHINSRLETEGESFQLNQTNVPKLPTDKPHEENLVHTAVLEKLPIHNAPETSQPVVASNISAEMKNLTPHRAPKIILTVLISLFLLGALGAGAYFYYLYQFLSPVTLVQKMLSAKEPEIFSSNFTITYNNGQSQMPIVTSLSGDSYTDSSNNQTTFQTNLKLDYNQNNQGQSFSFQISKSQNAIYLSFSDAKKLEALLGKPVSAVKINLDDLGFTQDQSQNSKLTAIWQNMLKQGVIAPQEKTVKKQSLNNEPVYLLTFKLDKEKALPVLQNFVGDISKTASLNEQLKNQPEVIAQLIKFQDQLQIFLEGFNLQKLEIWIGQKDYLVRKIVFASNAPSFPTKTLSATQPVPVPENVATTTTGLLPTDEQATKRDTQRVADIRNMLNALSKYAKKFGGYPEGLNGIPQDNFSPMYIKEIPKAPTPEDGTCTEYYNTYWYTAKGQAKMVKGKKVYPDFEYTFCLGQQNGNISQGIGQATPKGITGGITCPINETDKCSKPLLINTSDAQIPQPQLPSPSENNPNFSGALEINFDYFNFGQTKDISFPIDAIDLKTFIFGQPLSSTSTPK